VRNQYDHDDDHDNHDCTDDDHDNHDCTDDDHDCADHDCTDHDCTDHDSSDDNRRRGDNHGCGSDHDAGRI
jgi:hypothetical protein